jgi:hypothetical protein
MADFKNLDVYKKVTLYWGKYYGNFPSTQSSFGEYSMQRGFSGFKRCKPLNIPNAVDIPQ